MCSAMTSPVLTFALAALLVIAPLPATAQGTRIQVPKNKYTSQQDIQLGQQAAAEIKRQLPLLPENGDVDQYVESVGRRLVAAVPREYRHPEFRYQFDVVNARDINAFALPGGPMFVNRGMIEAAHNEGEMAGVMAHELSHVVLRHGTAQATEAQSAKYQLPAIGGAILGAIIGGNVGSVIAQGTQLGVSAYFLKYSRDYERQADILGSQIMARAGYDPRDLANMFRTIERESGGNGPEWLSSHPNPGNRYDLIMQEADRLRVNRDAARLNTAGFNRVQSELHRMAPAPTMSEIERRGAGNQSNGRRYPSGSRIEQRVASPSSRYSTYDAGNLFRVSVPSNWQRFEDQNSVTFAPQGAFGSYQGQSVFTHGAVAGAIHTGATNLETATNQYINALLTSNSYLRQQGRSSRTSIDGHRALAVRLAGRSPVTGRTEVVTIYTTLLRNGGLFYLINVAPNDEFRQYDQAFSTMLRSVRLNG